MKIAIYSTPTCPWCVLAKNYFKSKNIPFEDIDVSADQEKAQEMVEISGQMGVPVITFEKDGSNDVQVVIGFDKNKIEEIIKSK